MSQTKAQLINAVDGSIVTADLADDAVTAAKLAHTSVTAGSYTTADITVDAQGRITAAASGTIANAEIADGAITNAKVNASAAIAGTKVSPDFGSQAIATTGALSCFAATISGDNQDSLNFTGTSTNANRGIAFNSKTALSHSNDSALRINNNAEFSSVNIFAVDNATSAFTLNQGSNEYITVDTNNSSELITLGNTTTNPKTAILGGNVGIGTTSPLSKLNIFDGSDNDAILFVQGADTTSEYVSLGVQTGKAIVRGGGSGSTNTALVFEYSNAGTETEGMRIDSSGRVHIGTATNRLGETLHVLGQGIITSSAEDTNMMLFGTFGGSTALIGAFNNIPVVFRQNNTERMRIDSSGRVGIGTTSPSDTLEVAGSIRANTGTDISMDSNASGQIRFRGNGYTGAIALDATGMHIYQNSGTRSLIFGVNETERMRIDSSGRVGIGTSSPLYKLDVADNDATGVVALNLRNTNSTNNANTRIRFQGTRATDSSTFHLGELRFINTDSTNRASDFTISTHIGGSTTEKFRINSSGLVGIGTTSPVAPFHVYNATNNTIARLESGDATARLHFKDNSGQAYVGATGDNLIFSNTSSTTERMRIDSSGRVLLGTTTARDNLANNPSGVAAQLQLEGTSGTKSLMSIVRNTNDASDGGIVIGKSRGTSVGSTTAVQAGDDLGHITFAGADGTTLQFGAEIKGEVQSGVGNDDMPTALLFSTNGGSTNMVERMRIDSSGRVLIGTTTEGTVDSDDLTIATSGNTGITIRSGTTHNGAIHFSDATSGAAEYAGYIDYDHNVDKFDMGNNSGRFLSSDSNRVVSIGNASFGGSSGVIGYGSTGGLRKDSILALNASATVAGRGAGVSVGGNSSAIGSFYCNKAGNADSDGGTVYLESAGDLNFRTNGANDRAIIKSSGYVGIGTTHVEAPLSVARDVAASASFNLDNNTMMLRNSGTNSTANRTSLYFRTHAADNKLSPSGIRCIADSNYKSILAFHTNGNGNGTGHLEGYERMRIDGAGNIGIGTTTIADDADHCKLAIAGQTGSAAGILAFQATNGDEDGMVFADGGSLFIVADRSNASSSSSIRFRVDGSSEKMRILSNGKILINRTNEDGSGQINLALNASGHGISTRTASNSTQTHLDFGNQNGVVGSIQTNGSSTSFNTSSDYRLKENAVAISDGITRLKTLKPYRFNFKTDSSTILDGFFAHEVTAVPEAISGTKDAVDKDNNPIHQGIDHSKLVPLLVAAVQELIGKVEILEAA